MTTTTASSPQKKCVNISLPEQSYRDETLYIIEQGWANTFVSYLFQSFPILHSSLTFQIRSPTTHTSSFFQVDAAKFEEKKIKLDVENQATSKVKIEELTLYNVKQCRCNAVAKVQMEYNHPERSAQTQEVKMVLEAGGREDSMRLQHPLKLGCFTTVQKLTQEIEGSVERFCLMSQKQKVWLSVKKSVAGFMKWIERHVKGVGDENSSSTQVLFDYYSGNFDPTVYKRSANTFEFEIRFTNNESKSHDLYISCDKFTLRNFKLVMSTAMSDTVSPAIRVAVYGDAVLHNGIALQTVCEIQDLCQNEQNVSYGIFHNTEKRYQLTFQQVTSIITYFPLYITIPDLWDYTKSSYSPRWACFIEFLLKGETLTHTVTGTHRYFYYCNVVKSIPDTRGQLRTVVFFPTNELDASASYEIGSLKLHPSYDDELEYMYHPLEAPFTPHINNILNPLGFKIKDRSTTSNCSFSITSIRFDPVSMDLTIKGTVRLLQAAPEQQVRHNVVQMSFTANYRAGFPQDAKLQMGGRLFKVEETIQHWKQLRLSMLNKSNKFKDVTFLF